MVRTFPRFYFGYFRKCVARSEKLVYDYYGLWLGKPSPGQKLKSYGSKSFSFIGCSLWNKLSNHITKLDKFNTFKRIIKTHLFDNL